MDATLNNLIRERETGTQHELSMARPSECLFFIHEQNWKAPKNHGGLKAPKNPKRALNKLMRVEDKLKSLVYGDSLHRWFWFDIIEELFIKNQRKFYEKLLPRESIESVYKDQLDIPRAKSYPITNLLEFKGRQAKCIFHDDNKPSLYYYPDTNTVYCFACQTYGDSISVYQKLNNCNFIDAVKKLQ